MYAYHQCSSFGLIHTSGSAATDELADDLLFSLGGDITDT